MSTRSGAVHVATTIRRYKDKVYETHLLRRTYRDGPHVKHETLGNISHLPTHLIDLIRRALKGETFLSADQGFECVRSLPHGHVVAVLGTLHKLGIEELIASKRCLERDRVVALIAARILEPGSKLATARGLSEETAVSTLGECVGQVAASAEDLYRAMDWILPRQVAIENRLAKRHLSDGTLVLYDVTSTYFEGRHCPLAKLGHNRDGKKGKLQIVIGLLCERSGRPVAIEVFEGNTGDPNTVASQVQKIRTRFGLERVVLVGDRGMLTEARLEKDVRSVEGLSFISALRSPAIRALMNRGAIQRTLFDTQDLAEIHSPDFPGERLVVCRNPLLAEERTRKRKELLAATEKELEKILAATKRPVRPFRGKDRIALRLGRVHNRFKMAKHFKLTITENTFTYERDDQNIAEEAALDGFYVIRTNLPKLNFSAEETVRAYKGLSEVERAFRSMKTVDLKIRPIHHHLEDRVRAHVFLCMLAYYVEWHMRDALAPMLFDDEEPEAGDKLRSSIVAPAQRSPSAIKKAHARTSQDGMPVHSFQTLLDDLGTIVRNTMKPPGPNPKPFTLITTPTPVQRRALDLLGVSLNM